ncbi:hypothetical protein MLD38_001327 [Melastoma candidum]|uniref:Uncharacterized protein n=1 Tax=Melastoma candidum TaxID=119954 RepID=A0ACB9SEH8_9MYRT|nr:hypothetical protein MLD38_001327 [Melastoma candidum]
MEDLSVDALARCADYLSLHDIVRLAMSSRFLRTVAYSDSVWLRLFRERWPLLGPPVFATGVRDAYLDRLSAVRQFKFSDPLNGQLYTDPRGCNLMLLDDANLYVVQGSTIVVENVNGILAQKPSYLTLKDHNARVTCMRLFHPSEFSLRRNIMENEENVLVTSSSDHSIRLWWKGSSRRCLKGHSGPVSTLSNELLGDPESRLLASGGEDGTVRLWSVSSSSKRGHHALKATLHGHEKAVKFLSVAGHKPSLLVSVSRDSKIRVWDTTASSAVRSSCCVGMTSLSGSPVNVICHECLLYIASGSNVSAIDLRTMGTVLTVAAAETELCSFQMVPSKSLICTGHYDGAMLWDIRKTQGTMKVQPVTELEGHSGPVLHLYTDSYKIITGSPDDVCVRVWDTGSGIQTNNLSCYFGCSSVAAKGARVATASVGGDGEFGVVQLRDFNHASKEFHMCGDDEHEGALKFWESGSLSDENSIEYDLHLLHIKSEEKFLPPKS